MKEIDEIKIEIWSDLICPFCYLGKRKLEIALADFKYKEIVSIEWKSFQLDPDMETRTDISIHEYLASAKNISIDQAKRLNYGVAQAAADFGLEYNFDKAVVANTLKAHCFLHFAKEHGKQNELKELLFKSYFTDGKNIDSVKTLAELAESIGLNSAELIKSIENYTYIYEVEADRNEAKEIGIRGVPFFIFNRKVAVSGAQDPEIFKQALDSCIKNEE